MSHPTDVLSDRFMAHVAVRARTTAGALELASELERKLLTIPTTPEKAAAFLYMIKWLRLPSR